MPPRRSEHCAERSLGAISEEGGADRALAYKARYLESRLDAVLRSRSWRLIALARGALGRCNVLGRAARQAEVAARRGRAGTRHCARRSFNTLSGFPGADRGAGLQRL